MWRYLRRTEGQELVEFALILPLLLLLIFGIMDFGLAIFSYNTIANAAREGARAGVIPSASDADVVDATLRLTTGLNLTASNITVTRDSTIQVEVTYDHALITGPVIQAVGGDPILHLRTIATMQTE